jgi:hypothetical protein
MPASANKTLPVTRRYADSDVRAAALVAERERGG